MIDFTDRKERVKLVERIRQIRKRHGLSRAEFSRLLPAPYRTVEDWEQNRSLPSLYLKRALNDLERELSG